MLEAEGILTAQEIERRSAVIKGEIDADADFAVDSPMPDPSFAFGRVTAQDGGPGSGWNGVPGDAALAPRWRTK